MTTTMGFDLQKNDGERLWSLVDDEIEPSSSSARSSLYFLTTTTRRTSIPRPGPGEPQSQVHLVLKELVRKSIAETQELKRFPTLQDDIAAASNDSLEKFRDESRKIVLILVEMESSYLTVEFFHKLQAEPEKAPNQPNQSAQQNLERYSESHFRSVGGVLYVIVT